MLSKCFGWILLFSAIAFSQNFSGTYVIQTQTGNHSIRLIQNGLQVSGTLLISGNGEFRIDAQIVDGDEAVGFVSSGNSREYFEAMVEDNELEVTIAQWDAQANDIVWGSEQEFIFTRQGSSGAAAGGLGQQLSGSDRDDQNSGSGNTYTDPTRQNRDANASAGSSRESGEWGRNASDVNNASGNRIAVGQQYQAGARVLSASDGVSFVIPGEWLGALPANSPAFILGSNTKPGVGMVIMKAKATLNDAIALLNTPQDLGEGVVLYPEGMPEQTGNRVRIRYNAGQYIGRATAVVGKKGNGAIFFFGGPANQAGYYEKMIRDLVASCQFSSPEASGEAQRWRQLLSGMMLKRMSSYYSSGLDGAYVGGSSSQTLHLCSDGSYAYSSNSSLGVDAGGGGSSGYSGGNNAEYGRWELETTGASVSLVLRAQNGEVTYNTIQMNQEGHTILNGERAYRVQSERCR